MGYIGLFYRTHQCWERPPAKLNVARHISRYRYTRHFRYIDCIYRLYIPQRSWRRWVGYRCGLRRGWSTEDWSKPLRSQRPKLPTGTPGPEISIPFRSIVETPHDSSATSLSPIYTPLESGYIRPGFHVACSSGEGCSCYWWLGDDRRTSIIGGLRAVIGPCLAASIPTRAHG